MQPVFTEREPAWLYLHGRDQLATNSTAERCPWLHTFLRFATLGSRLQGVATEAANALVRYAFGALGMRRVGLTHSGGNEASRRIAERLGFSFEGIQRGQISFRKKRTRIGTATLDLTLLVYPT